MAKDLTAPPVAAADPLFGKAWASAATPRSARAWTLPLINGLAVAAIIGAVGYRVLEANLPADVLREEGALIGLGSVLGLVAIGVRASPYWQSLPIRLAITALAAILAVIVLSVAGRWLGDDLPPLAAVSLATVLLQFDLGLQSRHFAYVFAIALVALVVIWVYGVSQLMLSLGTVAIWTGVLFGLSVLTYLTSRTLERDLTAHVERQASLLATLSDLGEGLLITEDGRFVAGNDAYVKLTGYTRAELEAMPTLIALAPPEDQRRLAASLARRLSGGEEPGRYTSALINKSGRRVELEVAIHRVASRRNQLLTHVSDITERLRAEQAESEMETRFRTLFEQAQAGMAFTTLDGHISTVNPTFCELVGYSDVELRTLSLLDITHPDDVGALREAMQQMLAGGEEGRRIEKRYTRKSGEHVWVDLNMLLVRSSDQRPMYFQTVAVDIRDRKRAEVLQAARFAVTQALVTSPGWDKAAPGVLEGLCRTLDWELAEYWEVDPEREAMHFVTSWKRPGRDTSAFETTASQVTYRRGEGLAGRVWEAGTPNAWCAAV